MAEVELVIKVSEELYNRFGHEYSDENLISKYTNDAILDAFCNGKPLPKGHGRLIDADAFKKKVCTYQQTGCGDCKHSLCCPEDVPTIIEADKGESEE